MEEPVKLNLQSVKDIIDVKSKFEEILRDCDEIIPNLYLGNGPVAQNIERLKDLGVSHILNAAYGQNEKVHILTSQEFYEKKNFDCVFFGVPAIDIFTFPLIKHFESACDFIEKSLNEDNGIVLVHCVYGLSRSAILVVAYLMVKKGLGVLEAFRLVRSKRKINPNNGFIEQIIQFDKKLKNVDEKVNSIVET